MKVLIVDDSAVYQSKIKSALSGVPWLEVIGTASNGQAALETLDTNDIDLITLDMEMPVLSGLETLRKLRLRSKRPKVIVFSSSTQQGSEKTFEALALGANDFVAKPVMGTDGRRPEDIIRDDLLPKIRQFVTGSTTTPAGGPVVGRPLWQTKHIDTFIPSVVVIASSTGGPAAHEAIFRELEGNLRCPVLIAQHMPPVFTTTFAKRLSSYKGLPCREAADRELLKNEVYVAPGDFHMSLSKDGSAVALRLDKGPPRNSVRPAADGLFESAAALYPGKAMAFVLTGMGEDGLAGCRAIKESGGGVMIQDQASSVVFGMPGAVQAAGLNDAVGNLEAIRKQVRRMVLK